MHAGENGPDENKVSYKSLWKKIRKHAPLDHMHALLRRSVNSASKLLRINLTACLNIKIKTIYTG